MNTLESKALAKKVVFSENDFSVEFSDGRTLTIPIAYFPRLLNAAPEQRLAYTISGGGTGLHWDELDEDILVQNLLFGFGDTTLRRKDSSIKAA